MILRITTTLLGLLLIIPSLSCGGTTDPPSSGPDTTSHNFTWTLEYLGDGGASVLFDVAILNDTLAFAVGELSFRDSTGQIDLQKYNVARWDGIRWKPERLYYQGGMGAIQSVFALSDSQAWLDTWCYWDGRGFREVLIDPLFIGVGVHRMWGKIGALYAVSNSGFIAMNDGRTWQRIPTGTTLPIRDIWGGRTESGVEEILAVACGYSVAEGRKLLRISGLTVTAVDDSGLGPYVNGIYFVPNQQYYIVGAGIHHKASLDEPAWTFYPSGEVTSYASEGIRGNGSNDVMVVGSYLEIVHYNGATWHNYKSQIPNGYGAFGRVAMRGNLAIAVGLSGQRAVVAVGKRH